MPAWGGLAGGSGRSCLIGAGQLTDVPGVLLGAGVPAGLGVLTTISRASFAPLATGPPANTSWPGASAFVLALPWSRTTVSLTSSQVMVVPLAARMTTSVLLTDWIVPRSNASVRVPPFVVTVNEPYSPPSRRSRRSGPTRFAVGVVLDAFDAFDAFDALSKALSSVVLAELAGLAALAVLPVVVAAANAPPATTPASVMPTAQRVLWPIGARKCFSIRSRLPPGNKTTSGGR